MWLEAYIREAKRQLRDVHGFKSLPGSTDEELLLEVPDGEYPVTIHGRVDRVHIQDDVISVGNFEPDK